MEWVREKVRHAECMCTVLESKCWQADVYTTCTVQVTFDSNGVSRVQRHNLR